MANPNPEPIPPWLENLVKMQFFNDCNIHGIGDPNASASKCNMFCLDCYNMQGFCSLCRRSEHNGHRVLQVRRLKKLDVVRYSEIKDDMDIRDVQTYTGEELVYLNERPKREGARGSDAVLVCRNCRRPLKNDYRFCSLGCKVEPAQTKSQEAREESNYMTFEH